jgi:predicted TIM-barrel fold metal-dependent hydrolase
MSAASPLKIVDFHNHYVGPSFTPTVPNRALVDPEALLASMESGIATRVINTPLEFLRDKEGTLPPGIIPKINDAVAELVARHPGRLYGLATVDAFGGEESAHELKRAITELGLRGVFLESAQDGLLPDAPEARPTYATAAALGIPVFIHPIEDAMLFGRFKRYGRHGVRLTRGTINAAALFALLESGMFEELPGLRVVVTSLALGGVLLAAGTAEGARLRKETPADKRRHVYLDTTGLDAAAVRCAVDLVGADHVVMGTDWPVVLESAERIRSVLDACGLDAGDRELIAAGNTLRLLNLIQ